MQRAEAGSTIGDRVGHRSSSLREPAPRRVIRRAIGAARDLLRETGNHRGEPWIPLGVGVHTGVKYVGRVGEDDACDFSAVGDPVNAIARLASAAGAGEILVSAPAAGAAGLETNRDPALPATIGRLALRGIPGRWGYADVVAGATPALRA